jgi:hypothetical protein
LEEEEYVLLGCQCAAGVGDGGGDDGVSNEIRDAINIA